MSLTREQILEYAQRYVPDATGTDFPFNRDLFCFFERSSEYRDLANSTARWKFGGYAICLKYTLDEDTKPEGKWLWLHFVSLSTFPPARQVLKLQPPHVVLGEFQSSDRSMDIRIVRMDAEDVPSPLKNNNQVFLNPQDGSSPVNDAVNEDRQPAKPFDIPPLATGTDESASLKNSPSRAGKILQFPSRNLPDAGK
jgi:hypothetical protein